MVQNGSTTELEGKRAIVTGGSRGIGAGIVRRLLDAGATVVATARSSTADTPTEAKFVQGDVSTAAGARAVAEAALELLGGIDIVVNNAGGSAGFPGGAGTIGDADWQAALDINYLAAVRLNAALLPALLEQCSGAIVHISSVVTTSTPPQLLHYAAAKAALEVYSKGLSLELAPRGIRVNTIAPGIVVSPGADALRQSFADAGGFDPSVFVSGIPLGRAGVPSDIAEAVGFLVSDRAAWITGANLVIDGGQTP
jgi:NAD(P)-dependent dehydrogenase (short-subunit alcohol dehydrogenase family)